MLFSVFPLPRVHPVYTPLQLFHVLLLYIYSTQFAELPSK